MQPAKLAESIETRAGSTEAPIYRSTDCAVRQSVTVAVAALAMTLVIISGGIDLSVGSAVSLVTVVIALLLKHNFRPAKPPPAA